MINVMKTLENYIFDYEEKHPEVLSRNERWKNPPGPFRKGGIVIRIEFVTDKFID